MREDVKKLWVDALRSGEYDQGKNKLRPTESKYCCLGVLCDIYCKENNKNREDFWIQKNFLINLPQEVVEWAELESTSPALDKKPRGYNTLLLSNLNDDGVSFDEIADLIEEDLTTGNSYY